MTDSKVPCDLDELCDPVKERDTDILNLYTELYEIKKWLISVKEQIERILNV